MVETILVAPFLSIFSGFDFLDGSDISIAKAQNCVFSIDRSTESKTQREVTANSKVHG